MIKSGEKKEEYRKITDYWARRFISARHEGEWATWMEMIDDLQDPNKNHDGYEDLMNFFEVDFKNFDTITFSNGYAKDHDQFEIELKGISIGEGNPDWGAIPGKKYFVLELGEIL